MLRAAAEIDTCLEVTRQDDVVVLVDADPVADLSGARPEALPHLAPVSPTVPPSRAPRDATSSRRSAWRRHEQFPAEGLPLQVGGKDFALDLLFFATCWWNGWRLIRPVLTDEEDAGVSVKQWLPRGR